jgi:hypothetical protein
MVRPTGWNGGTARAVLFLAAAALAQGALAEPPKPEDDPIRTQLAIELHVKLGPTEPMGPSIDGDRSVYPIVGGTFSGPGIKGRVVPGGGDFYVERPDGVGVVDALYRLETDDGAIIIIHNKGFYIPTEAGRRKEKAGQPQQPEDRYFRTVPEFVAPKGRYDWLNRSIFVGSGADGAPGEVIIRVYRVS